MPVLGNSDRESQDADQGTEDTVQGLLLVSVPSLDLPEQKEDQTAQLSRCLAGCGMPGLSVPPP